MFNSIKKNRKSVFREVGLATEDAGTISPRIVLKDPFEPETDHRSTAVPSKLGRLNTEPGERGVPTGPSANTNDDEGETTRGPNSAAVPHSQPRSVVVPTAAAAAVQSEPTSPQSSTSTSSSKTPWYVKLLPPTGRNRTRVRVGSGSAPPSPFFGVTTMTMLALAVAVIAPTLLGGQSGQDNAGGVVDAGPILTKRADDATGVCARWAQQSKLEIPLPPINERFSTLGGYLKGMTMLVWP